MALNAKEIPGGGPRPDPIEPGTYPARLVQVISLGLQEQRPYQGQEKPPQYELYLTYELLDEFMKSEDGEDDEAKPRWISETISLHNLAADKAKSTKRYYALDPTEEYEGDWSQLVETPCMVTVVVNEGKGKNAGKKFNNISAVSAMRPKEAAKAKPLVNKPVVFDIDDPDLAVYNAFPDWLKKKFQDGLEFKQSPLYEMIQDNPSESDDSDDDDEKKW